MNGRGKNSKKQARGKVQVSQRPKDNKIITTIIISALVLLVGGYVVYTMGLHARVLTGAVVADEKVKASEAAYYFHQVVNQYYMQGLISSPDDLDDRLDADNDTTYRDIFYEEALRALRDNVLLTRLAKQDGFDPVGAKAQVDAVIDLLFERANEYRSSADRVLKSEHGPGMSLRAYKNAIMRELTASEYEEHIRQTRMMPDDATIEATYNENPKAYENVTLAMFFFPAQVDANATADEREAALDEAMEKASELLDNAHDEASFLAYAKQMVEDTPGYESLFDAEGNPTLYEDLSYEMIEMYLGAQAADDLFDVSRRYGDTAVYDSSVGAFAVFYIDRTRDETIAVIYREIVLVADVDAADKEAMAKALDNREKEANAMAKEVTDEASFIQLAKKNTDLADGRMTGGLQEGITHAYFVENNAHADTSAWLFDDARVSGDVVVLRENSSVRICYYVNRMPLWKVAIARSLSLQNLSAWMDDVLGDEDEDYVIYERVMQLATSY